MKLLNSSHNSTTQIFIKILILLLILNTYAVAAELTVNKNQSEVNLLFYRGDKSSNQTYNYMIRSHDLQGEIHLDETLPQVSNFSIKVSHVKKPPVQFSQYVLCAPAVAMLVVLMVCPYNITFPVLSKVIKFPQSSASPPT